MSKKMSTAEALDYLLIGNIVMDAKSEPATIANMIALFERLVIKPSMERADREHAGTWLPPLEQRCLDTFMEELARIINEAHARGFREGAKQPGEEE